jgi:hypothetical protein
MEHKTLISNEDIQDMIESDIEGNISIQVESVKYDPVKGIIVKWRRI